MRRRAEPCRTFLVTTHMCARTRMHARGFGSQENRFGRYGRFGRRPAAGTYWSGTVLFVTISHTFTPCGVLFPPLNKYATVAIGPTRGNVGNVGTTNTGWTKMAMGSVPSMDRVCFV
jgi:hypothetical protein